MLVADVDLKSKIKSQETTFTPPSNLSLKERQAKLINAKIELKKHFVGIDNVIDRIFDEIEAWYCMPEVLVRPVIVCLWGMTGTGKTDLVRRLVSLLDLSDSFLEIQMTNKGSSQHYSPTLSGIVGNSNIVPEKQGILLLDEIQRFRSIDDTGKEIHDYSFQDIWMLLSDGTFGSISQNKNEIMEMIMDIHYSHKMDKFQEEQNAAERAAGKTVTEKKETMPWFYSAYRDASKIKRLLSRPESLEEIIEWDEDQKLKVLHEGLNNKDTYKPIVYSKMLIFISGNIDEAYRMQSDIATNVDADVFHSASLNITNPSIKKALQKRFKSEQIARFGNCYVIYPALSKASYKEIISRKTKDIEKRFSESSKMEISLDQSVQDAVYRNGVYPVQGTRPLFSTISTVLESPLPKFIIKAKESKVKKFRIGEENGILHTMMNGEKFEVNVNLDVDTIQAKISEDSLISTCVHEAGHAILYSHFYGVAPKDINGKTLSGGSVSPHTMYGYQPQLDLLAVYWGGQVAEQLVFGEKGRSLGSSSDLTNLTQLAAALVRSYGLGKWSSQVVSPHEVGSAAYVTDLQESNKHVERITKRQKAIATQILKKYKRLLAEVSEYMAKHDGQITKKKYSSIAAKHNLKAKVVGDTYAIEPKYSDAFEKFKTTNR